MRANTLSIDMDFRIIPSAVPLHSPSPDRKSINVITPTISPNAIQIKKNITPTKSRQGDREKQNSKFINELQTETKYHSHSHTQSMQSGSDYFTALKQKDEIIKNLRNIIDMFTESTRYKKPNQEEELQLKNQVKILTIENQKLVNIIEKMSKNKNGDENNGKKHLQLQNKINQLMQTIKDNENFYQQQTKELKRFNKSLNTQYRNLENQKKQLQLENKKLMKILKQKNEGERMKNSDTIDQSIYTQEKSMNSNKSQERLTLIKIRQQHSQNLKMLKEGLIKQIEQTFDTMRIALEGINIKINSLSKRLESIQKLSWERVKKTHIERESITISIREGEVQEGSETDRSFKFQRKNNSQIYIEQGPSSSHERASRDEFTRLEEIPSQKNLSQTLPLADQLNATKAELYQLRFKYEKLCLDTSSVGFSERVKQEEDMIKYEKYEQSLRILEEKQRQIAILYEQVKKIEEENFQKCEQKNKQIAKRDEQIAFLKQDLQRDYSRLHEQTQKKINLLVQNYEQQLQILRKQIGSLNSQLSESQKRITDQKIKQHEPLSSNEKEQKQNAAKLQVEFLQKQIVLLQEKHEHECKIISEALSQTELSLNQERKKKQLMQQNMLVLSSQLNQHRIYIDSLKAEIAEKCQQFERMKSLKQQVQQNLDKEMQNTRKYKDLIIEREGDIVRLRKTLAQFQTKSLLRQIQWIETVFEKQFKQTRSIELEEDQASLGSNSQFEQLRELKQKLLKCETLIVQQQGKIYELQNLLQLTKNKLKEQEQSYQKLMSKCKTYENTIEKYRVKKEKESSILTGVGKNIADKLQALKKLEIERLQLGRLVLQSKGEHNEQSKK